MTQVDGGLPSKLSIIPYGSVASTELFEIHSSFIRRSGSTPADRE